MTGSYKSIFTLFLFHISLINNALCTPPPHNNNTSKSTQKDESLSAYVNTHYLSKHRPLIHIKEIQDGNWGNPIDKRLVVNNEVSRRGIIDFTEAAWGAYTVAQFSHIDIAKDNILILKNIKLNHSLFVDKKVLEGGLFDKIACEENGRLYKIRTVDYVEYWPIRRGWTYIRPSNELWVPTPEPATYGALVAASTLILRLFRKRRALLHISSLPTGGKLSHNFSSSISSVVFG